MVTVNVDGKSAEVAKGSSLTELAKLLKRDRAFVAKVDGELKAMLGRWEAQIRDKVGASVIKISELDPAKQHQHMSQEKIRGKGMALFFDVL